MDQSLRYELAAVVGDLAALGPLSAVHPGARVVPLDVESVGLVPVTAELAAAAEPSMICSVLGGPLTGGPRSVGRPGAEVVTGPESGFDLLTPGLVALLEAVSASGPVGYLEADYEGRDGRQTAAAWDRGAVVLGPLLLGRYEPFVAADAPISAVLRRVGIEGRTPGREFLMAGLGRYRRTAEWE